MPARQYERADAARASTQPRAMFATPARSARWRDALIRVRVVYDDRYMMPR